MILLRPTLSTRPLEHVAGCVDDPGKAADPLRRCSPPLLTPVSDPSRPLDACAAGPVTGDGEIDQRIARELAVESRDEWGFRHELGVRCVLDASAVSGDTKSRAGHTIGIERAR